MCVQWDMVLYSYPLNRDRMTLNVIYGDLLERLEKKSTVRMCVCVCVCNSDSYVYGYVCVYVSMST